jgi:hypothetical protein
MRTVKSIWRAFIDGHGESNRSRQSVESDLVTGVSLDTGFLVSM